MILTRKETHQVEPIFRQAAVVPDSIDEERRSVKVTFSTGAKVRRFNWWEGFFHVSLSLKRKHVRLDRLNRGAPVLNQHLSRDLNDVLGVVENAKIEKGPDGEYEATATLRFSEREAADVVFKDIKAGIIRNVSVGFEVHEFEELEPLKGRNGGDPERHFLAVDWEPFEISPVGMPADPGAQVRSFGLTDCNFNLRGDESMKTRTTGGAPSNPGVSEDNGLSEEEIAKREAEAAANAVKAERERLTEIRKVCQQVNLDGEFMSKLLEANPEIKVDEVRQKVIEELGNKDKRTGDTRGGNVTIIREERDTIKRGMTNALCHRNNPSKNELTDEGGMFRKMRMSEMARHCLESAGVSTRGMSDHEVCGLVFRAGGSHSSSDFPEILADVTNKTLRDAYDEAPQTWRDLAREVEVSDFKEISRVQLGDAPSLLEIKENGEIKDGTIGEAAEKYFVKTYARKLTVTRKMLVNDDMAAFTRLPELFGRAARDLESDLVWAIITGNPLMGDGIALFDTADHGNLAGAGSAISVASIGAGRAAMRKQVGLGGRLMNIAPVRLYVPTDLETVAEQFTSQNFQADQAGNTNPFRGKLTAIAEPRLDAASVTAWFLAASTGQIDIIEVARLIGESGPVVETMETFDVEGMKMKVRSDFGAKAIDWRGLYKNPGA